MINSYLHCGNICAGTVHEVRPTLPGLTQIKNKSNSTYVKDEVYMAWHRAVKKRSLAGTEKSLLSPP